MRRYTQRELEKMIYGALAAHLRGGACIDTDNNEFIEQLYPVQVKLAKKFDDRAEAAPAIPE